MGDLSTKRRTLVLSVLTLPLQPRDEGSAKSGRMVRLLFGRSRRRGGPRRAGLRRRLHQLRDDYVRPGLRLGGPRFRSVGLVGGRARSDPPAVGAFPGEGGSRSRGAGGRGTRLGGGRDHPAACTEELAIAGSRVSATLGAACGAVPGGHATERSRGGRPAGLG